MTTKSFYEQRLHESILPSIAKSLERIASALEELLKETDYSDKEESK